jgi:hypothetical protein
MYVMRLTVWWSLYFVAFGFFFKAVVVIAVKSLGHFPMSYMLISRVSSLRPSSQQFEYLPNYVVISCTAINYETHDERGSYFRNSQLT